MRTSPSTALAAIAALAAIPTLAPTASAQQFWSGYDLAFTKPNNANWTLPQFQDRLTPNVWLTRQNDQGLFNIVNEPSYLFTSPTDTQWAYGTIADGVQNLTFNDWVTWHSGNPLTSLNRNAVLHLVTDNIYIDIRFTQWTRNAAGGGFAYLRGQPPAPCLPDFQPDGSLNIFDILAFFNAFASASPAADLAGPGSSSPDGSIDIFDILAFFNLFAQGC